MYPGFEGVVEKLQPVLANMEHDRLTQKQVLVAETGRNPTEVKKVPAMVGNVQ